jgi:MFS family permease
MLGGVQGLLRQLRDSAAAYKAIFGNRNLRNLQFAWAGATIGDWAYAVAVSVFAYRHDGATADGLVWLVRMIPSAVVSPFAAVLADRFPRERVMLLSDLTRALIIGGAAAVAYAGWSPLIVYGLSVCTMLIGTPFKPAESALIAVLAKTPSELTAANVVGSTIESVGFFLGPAIAGILLGLTSAATVFAITAALVLWSVFFIARIHVPTDVPEEEPPEPQRVVTEVAMGFRALRADPRLRLLVGLLSAQTVISGAYEVLVVVTSLRLLWPPPSSLGDSGVGFLNSAFGVGALLGAAVAGALLVGVRRLSLPFITGSLLWGVPFLLIAVWLKPAFALIMFGILGIGATVESIAGFTLLQRAVPNELLGRVYGVVQMLGLAAVGIGAALTPAVISGLGARGTLIAVGSFVPLSIFVFGPKLVRIDAEATAPGAERLSLLRGIEIFAPLPGLVLEQLASQLIPLDVEPGTDIIVEGDLGDRFYIVREGEVEITAGGRHVADAGRSGYFGEIALLRDVPRTATCTARTDVSLFALEREDFLGAVTGNPGSSQAAETVITSRLTGLQAVTGSFGGLAARRMRI